MSTLMKLNVTLGWNLDFHALHDEPPLYERGTCTNLSEDLLQISRENVIIDLGFYQDRYRVMEIHNSNWDHPIRQLECTDRFQALQVVESWMNEL